MHQPHSPDAVAFVQEHRRWVAEIVRLCGAVQDADCAVGTGKRRWKARSAASLKGARGSASTLSQMNRIMRVGGREDLESVPV